MEKYELEKYENALKKFVNVKDFLLKEINGDHYCLSAKAYRMCFRLPLTFYFNRSVNQCIKEIKELAGDFDWV